MPELVFHLIRLGFLDGRPGLVFCTLLAFYDFLCWTNVYERRVTAAALATDVVEELANRPLIRPPEGAGLGEDLLVPLDVLEDGRALEGQVELVAVEHPAGRVVRRVEQQHARPRRRRHQARIWSSPIGRSSAGMRRLSRISRQAPRSMRTTTRKVMAMAMTEPSPARVASPSSRSTSRPTGRPSRSVGEYDAVRRERSSSGSSRSRATCSGISETR